MRKMYWMAAVVALALAGSAIVESDAQNVPQPPYMGTPVFGAGTKARAATMQPMGRLHGLTSPVGTATGTAEQTLDSYSLPANALDVVGRRLHIHAQWSKPSNGDTTTAKLYFGAESISSGANTSSLAGTVLDLIVVKKGPSTQVVTGSGYVGTTLLTPYSAAGAEPDTAAILIKATCTDGTSSANDCTLQDFEVTYLN